MYKIKAIEGNTNSRNSENSNDRGDVDFPKHALRLH